MAFSFKMVICGLKMAHLSFQRVPGQDLAENGPFAFKPHKEFTKKIRPSFWKTWRHGRLKKKVVWLQWIGYLGRVG